MAHPAPTQRVKLRGGSELRETIKIGGGKLWRGMIRSRAEDREERVAALLTIARRHARKEEWADAARLTLQAADELLEVVNEFNLAAKLELGKRTT